jgi:hypothetical protein
MVIAQTPLSNTISLLLPAQTVSTHLYHLLLLQNIALGVKKMQTLFMLYCKHIYSNLFQHFLHLLNFLSFVVWF